MDLEAGSPGDVVSDLHVWPLGPGKLAVIASMVSDTPRPPDFYKALLRDRSELVHVTVEVNPCDETERGDGSPREMPRPVRSGGVGSA